MARVLIADDEPGICSTLGKALKKAGIEHVETAQDGANALKLLAANHFDVAILDIYMPGMSGLEVAQAARRKGIDTDIVIMTGKATVATAIEALHSNVQDFIQKPFKSEEIITVIRKLVEKRRPPAHVLAERLDNFLKEHASKSTLKHSDMYTHFRISKSYACRLFQKYIDSTFRQRLSYHRVQRAKHLIESTNYLLYHIAEMSGFKNQQKLTEAFRRWEDMPPRKYREIGRLTSKK